MTAKPKIATNTPNPAASDELASFTMQSLVRQTGIAADTLRAWERRYGFPVPARTSGGHRLYTSADVAAIRWVLQKQHEGIRAKQAIELWQHQQLAPAEPPALAPTDNHETLVSLKSAWVRASLALDERTACQVFNSAAAMLGPESALVQVATAGLSDIGQLWAEGAASVAQEHFASGVAMRHVQSLLNGEAPPMREEKVLVTCPAGEIHVYPSVVLSYLLRRAGWNSLFMGADLPRQELARVVATERPACVLIAVQTVPALRALLAGANMLAALGVTLGFGGSVFVRYPSLIARVPGVYLGDRLTDAPETLPRALNGTIKPNVPAPLESAWRELLLALPDALLLAEVELLARSEPLRPPGATHESQELQAGDAGLRREPEQSLLGLPRTALEGELALLRGYLLSVVALGAAELLPGIWAWSDQMQKARGFSAGARAAVLTAYRATLRRHLTHPNPLSAALEPSA